MNWIQGAIRHPGAFRRKASAAGMSTQAYATQEAHAPGVLGRQARLARTLGSLRKKKKHKKPSLAGHLTGLRASGAFRAGVGQISTHRAPGPRTYGAGVD